MIVWIVSKHMMDEAGIDETLKVFTNYDKAKEYEKTLHGSCTGFQFTEFEKRETIE